MEKVTDRILWTVFIVVIGVSLYIFGKPAFTNIIHNSTQQLSHSTKQWEGATFVDEQFAAGNDQWVNDGELDYVPQYTNQSNGQFPFQLTISNGVYHISSDSTMETTTGNSLIVGGFNVSYSNDHGDTFDTGDKLHATIEVKGHGMLERFGFEMGKVIPLYAGAGKVIDTHGKWETISYTSDSRPSKSSWPYRGLSFYVYRNPNTDLYVRNLNVTIN